MNTPTHAAPGVPTARQAYYALFILWLVHLIANVDRFAFGIVQQKIKIDLGLTDTQLGMSTGLAFVVAYLLFGIPVARWVDLANRRNILAGAVAVWSVMTAACGSATNFVQMVLARAGLGAGESPCVPGSVSLIGSYFPREKRTQAAGIFNSAAAAAGIIGTPIMGWIADHYGWRAGFFVFGVVGILLAVLVRLTLAEPVRDAYAVQAAPDVDGHVEAPLARMGMWQSFRHMYSIKAFRYLLAGHALFGIGFFAFATWLNVVLVRTYGLSYTQLGLFAGLGMGLTMAVSTVSSGFICPLIVRKTGNDRWMALVPAIVCTLAIPAMVVACLDVSVEVVMVACGVVFFMALARTPPMVSLVLDLIAPSMHSSAIMMMVIFANVLGSAVGPLITGMVSDALLPTLGSGPALRQALLWTAPVLAGAGALLAYLPARFVDRQIKPAV